MFGENNKEELNQNYIEIESEQTNIQNYKLLNV